MSMKSFGAQIERIAREAHSNRRTRLERETRFRLYGPPPNVRARQWWLRRIAKGERRCTHNS